ncbi:hypothetical protein P691DRAFT_627025, partial [Macrolepiota fuliginosa MF-IS2]
QCNTGSVQCCNNVGTTNDAQVAQALKGANFPGPTQGVVFGITCSPASAVGLGGSTWCVSR